MDLTQGLVYKHLTRLALPSAVALFFATMFFMVDTYFAGMISTEAQAALTVSFPVFFIIVSMMNGMAIGAQTLIANFLGEGRHERAKELSVQSLYFGAVFSLIMAAFGFFFAPSLLQFLGAKGAVAEYAERYIRITFLYCVFPVTTHVVNGILMSYGLAKPFRNWLIIGFFLHLTLDPWLIFGGMGLPAFGFDGIVYSTALTMFLGSCFMFYCLNERGIISKIAVGRLKPEWIAFQEIARQSLPATLNLLSVAIGLFITTGFVFQFGKNAAAAFGIGMRLQQLFLIATVGLSSAALAIISQNHGAKKFARVEECIRFSLYSGGVIMLASFLVLNAAPRQLMSIFSHDRDVIETGVSFLRIYSFTGFFLMGLNILTAAMQGMKNPITALMIGFGRQVVVPLIALPILIGWFEAPLESVWYMTLAVSVLFTALAFVQTKRILTEKSKPFNEKP
ncbi:MATE family efflux transporter [Estrella lausannensis]|uniref:Multidrug-efflux transporter n=1 Tax=Estrella lausannensis TaxID=483423 RepID=A0A0H5DRC3_9BACT|nr:MATE family efflux transporter [Estrella lausannensis]CRX39127.1 MATE efflux family protein [Estrella lausannensis]